MNPGTMKVKPWGKDQGDHVVINVADFDSAKHEKYDDGASDQGAGNVVVDDGGSNDAAGNVGGDQDSANNQDSNPGANNAKSGKKGK